MPRAKTWAVVGTDRTKRYYGSRATALRGAITHCGFTPDVDYAVFDMTGRKARLYTVARGSR